MTTGLLKGYAEHELRYQARKEISKQIRDHCEEKDSFTTGVTVMIGTILAMAVFSSMLNGGSRGRAR